MNRSRWSTQGIFDGFRRPYETQEMKSLMARIAELERQNSLLHSDLMASYADNRILQRELLKLKEGLE